MGVKGKRIQLSGSATLPTTMKLRAESGAILVGVNTVLTDDPLLTIRGTYSHRQPIRGVIDPHLRTPTNSKLLHSDGGDVWLFCQEKALSGPNAKALEEKGAHLAPLKKIASGKLDVTELFCQMASIGITSILVEGGPHLLTTLAKENLIDRWFLYLTPRVLGDAYEGQETLSFLEDGAFRLKFRSVIRRGEDWQIYALPK